MQMMQPLPHTHSWHAAALLPMQQSRALDLRCTELKPRAPAEALAHLASILLYVLLCGANRQQSPLLDDKKAAPVALLLIGWPIFYESMWRPLAAMKIRAEPFMSAPLKRGNVMLPAGEWRVGIRVFAAICFLSDTAFISAVHCVFCEASRWEEHSTRFHFAFLSYCSSGGRTCVI